MSTIQPTKELTVEQAERQLRYARLAEHKRTMAEGLAERSDEKVALGASRFLAIYRNKSQKKSKPVK